MKIEVGDVVTDGLLEGVVIMISEVPGWAFVLSAGWVHSNPIRIEQAQVLHKSGTPEAEAFIANLNK